MQENALFLLPPEGTDPASAAPPLKEAGFPVEVFGSPAELSVAVSKASPMGLVAPVTWKGKSLPEILRQALMAANRSSVPVVFQLGQEEEPPLICMADMLIARYLAPPFQPEEVANTFRLLQVERAFQRYRNKAEGNSNMGLLGDTLPIELLSQLSDEGFTGLVSFNFFNLFAHVHLKNGRMVEAVSHLLHNKHAIYRVLSWSTGTYWKQPNFPSAPAKVMRIKATMEKWSQKANERAAEIDRLLEGMPPEALLATLLVNEAQVRAAVTSAFTPAYPPLLLEAGEYLQILKHSHLGDLETTIALKKLEHQGILDIAPMSADESLSVQMPLGLQQMSQRRSRHGETLPEPDSSPGPEYEVTGYEAPPDFGDLDAEEPGEMWDPASSSGGFAIRDDLLDALPEDGDASSHGISAHGGGSHDGPPSFNEEAMMAARQQGRPRRMPKMRGSTPAPLALSAEIANFLELFHSLIFQTAQNKVEHPTFANRFKALFQTLQNIADRGESLRCFCNHEPPERLVVAAEGSMFPIKSEAAKEFFLVFGVEELTIETPDYDHLMRFCKTLVQQRENAESFFIGLFVKEEGLSTITLRERAVLEATSGEPLDDTSDKNGAASIEVVPVASEKLTVFKTWAELAEVGESNPQAVMDNILEQPLRIARMLTKYAEESDPAPARGGFTARQLWTMLHGLMLLDKITRKVEEFDETERLQTLHMVVDVLDAATLGGVIGLGLDYFGWNPFLTSVLTRLEPHDLRTSIGHWYRLLRWFFAKEARPGRILLHLRMKMHMLKLAQMRPDFEVIVEDLSRNRKSMGLEPVDLALIAGKTPPEFAMDGKLRRLAVQNLLIFRTRANHSKIFPVAQACMDKGLELELEVVTYLFTAMLKHPQTSLRQNAAMFLLDLIGLGLTAKSNPFLLRTLQKLEEGLARETEEAVLKEAIQGLTDMVQRLKAEENTALSDQVSRILVRLLDKNPHLKGQSRQALVQSTGSINIKNILPALIEDLAHPDHWDVSHEYLKSVPDQARLPLVERLLTAESHVLAERIVAILDEMGVSGIEIFDDRAKDERWIVRKNLALLWRVCREPHRVTILRTLLRDPKAEVRVEAMRSLAVNPDVMTERMLVEQFHIEAENRVRSKILNLLAEIGGKHAVEELAPLLQRKKRFGGGAEVSEQLQQEICQLFGHLGLVEASKELLKIVREKSLLGGGRTALQVSALHALGKYNNNEVKRTLLQMRNDSTENRLRMAAQHALDEIAIVRPAGGG